MNVTRMAGLPTSVYTANRRRARRLGGQVAEVARLPLGGTKLWRVPLTVVPDHWFLSIRQASSPGFLSSQHSKELSCFANAISIRRNAAPLLDEQRGHGCRA